MLIAQVPSPFSEMMELLAYLSCSVFASGADFCVEISKSAVSFVIVAVWALCRCFLLRYPCVPSSLLVQHTPSALPVVVYRAWLHFCSGYLLPSLFLRYNWQLISVYNSVLSRVRLSRLLLFYCLSILGTAWFGYLYIVNVWYYFIDAHCHESGVMVSGFLHY